MENLIKPFLFILVLFTLVWVNSGSNTNEFGYSTYCRKCLSSCEWNTNGKYYWCKTDNWVFKGDKYDWDYCSLNTTNEYLGRECLSVCAFHGESYQWCHAGEKWEDGYCSGKSCEKSVKMELPDYGFSTYCQPCITPCQKQTLRPGKYLCGTRRWKLNGQTWTWDYCSPRTGMDFKGNKCLSKCEQKDGKLYHSCKTEEKDGVGHCSGSTLCDFINPESF